VQRLEMVWRGEASWRMWQGGKVAVLMLISIGCSSPFLFTTRAYTHTYAPHTHTHIHTPLTVVFSSLALCGRCFVDAKKLFSFFIARLGESHSSACSLRPSSSRVGIGKRRMYERTLRTPSELHSLLGSVSMSSIRPVFRLDRRGDSGVICDRIAFLPAC